MSVMPEQSLRAFPTRFPGQILERPSCLVEETLGILEQPETP